MTKTLLNYLITAYQLTLSGLIGNQCRFYPSCSQYTRQAINEHGPVKGSALGLRRVCRCHPWNEGGYDPVPPGSPVQGKE